MAGNSQNQYLKLNHEIEGIRKSETKKCGDPMYYMIQRIISGIFLNPHEKCTSKVCSNQKICESITEAIKIQQLHASLDFASMRKGISPFLFSQTDSLSKWFNYPNNIRENIIFFSLFYFSKNLATFNSVLQSMQKANHCQI